MLIYLFANFECARRFPLSALALSPSAGEHTFLNCVKADITYFIVLKVVSFNGKFAYKVIVTKKIVFFI